MHPVIEEICRSHQPPVRLDVFRRWQQTLRQDIQPQLDELEALKTKKAKKPEPEPACA